jgi:hypothetical protein
MMHALSEEEMETCPSRLTGDILRVPRGICNTEKIFHREVREERKEEEDSPQTKIGFTLEFRELYQSLL